MNQFKSFYHILKADRVRNSIKTAVACLIGMLIIDMFKIQVGNWIVVSIVVIMSRRTTFGSAIKSSGMRVLGTIMGALFCLFVIKVLGTDHAVMTLMMALAMLLFVYMAGSSSVLADAGLLGAVTVALVLSAKQPTVTYLVDRSFEITLGVLIALIVTKFFLPIHAKFRLRQNVAQTLRDLAKMYREKIVERQQAYRFAEENDLENEIFDAFADQVQLISDASIELSIDTFKRPIFKKILDTERRIYRTINAFYHILHTAQSGADLIYNNNAFCELHEKMIAALERAAEMALDRSLRDQPRVHLLACCQHLLHTITGAETLNQVERDSLDIFVSTITYLAHQIERVEALCAHSYVYARFESHLIQAKH